MADATHCCRTCKHLNVPLDKAGRRVVRNDRGYTCLAVIEEPRVPDSVKKHYGWSWPPPHGWVSGDDGTNCPCYEKR